MQQPETTVSANSSKGRRGKCRCLHGHAWPSSCRCLASCGACVCSIALSTPSWQRCTWKWRRGGPQTHSGSPMPLTRLRSNSFFTPSNSTFLLNSPTAWQRNPHTNDHNSRQRNSARASTRHVRHNAQQTSHNGVDNRKHTRTQSTPPRQLRDPLPRHPTPHLGDGKAR